MSEPRSMESLLPLIRAAVDAGGEFKLITRGTSMLPLLRDGADTAVLVAPPETLRKGDVPLYRRSDGAFVLHRAVKISKDGKRFDARGDNQTVTEKNIPAASIEAVLCAVIRDGVRTDFDSAEYRRYCRGLPAHRLRLIFTRAPAALLRRMGTKK